MALVMDLTLFDNVDHETIVLETKRLLEKHNGKISQTVFNNDVHGQFFINGVDINTMNEIADILFYQHEDSIDECTVRNM